MIEKQNCICCIQHEPHPLTPGCAYLQYVVRELAIWAHLSSQSPEHLHLYLFEQSSTIFLFKCSQYLAIQTKMGVHSVSTHVNMRTSNTNCAPHPCRRKQRPHKTAMNKLLRHYIALHHAIIYSYTNNGLDSSWFLIFPASVRSRMLSGLSPSRA